MKSRLVPIIVILLALAFVGAARPPAACASSLTTDLRDRLTKQNLRVIQSCVEEFLLSNNDACPESADVSPGGLVGAPHVWPRNPWTGVYVSQSTSRGDFQYTHVTGVDTDTYTLRAKLSNGHWFTLAPTTFPGLVAQLRHKLDNEIVKRNVRVLQGDIHEWWLLNGSLPTGDQLAETGDVGAVIDYWPVNPFTNAASQPGSELGEYAYTPGVSGVYTLVGHEFGGDYTVDGQAPPLPGTQMPNPYKDSVVQSNLELIERAIEEYALDNGGVFPPSIAVAANQAVGNYLLAWPLSPWTGQRMEQNTSLGSFTYTTSSSADEFSLVTHLSDDTDYTLSEKWYEVRSLRLRAILNNLRAQAALQVIKAYVDQWNAANGALPTADQLSPAGAVGDAHTWWPVNPWVGSPMRAGSDAGQFTYTDNGDGTFSLTLHQMAVPPRYGGDFSMPDAYTAQ
jgi:hypothetical protein